MYDAYKDHKVSADNFDVYLFESQFLKYTQVLDTDYENYLLLYSCQESAEFLDKEDYTVPQWYAWSHHDKKHVRGRPVEFSLREDGDVKA